MSTGKPSRADLSSHRVGSARGNCIASPGTSNSDEIEVNGGRASGLTEGKMDRPGPEKRITGRSTKDGPTGPSSNGIHNHSQLFIYLLRVYESMENASVLVITTWKLKIKRKRKRKRRKCKKREKAKD